MKPVGLRRIQVSDAHEPSACRHWQVRPL